MRLLLAVALAFADSGGFTLNAEVLERYGFTLDQYNAMAPAEQRRVEDFIRAKEAERAAALSRRAEPKLDLETEELSALSRLSPGALFDKSAKPEAAAGSAWSADARLANGEASRFTLSHREKGLELQLGDLGAGGRSPLLGSSPYVNLKKGSSGSGDWLDYGYKVQTGVIDLRARLYHDDNPAVDGRLDRSLSILGRDMPEALSYSTDFQRDRLLVGSALGHFGRAYHLFGPVDLGWSAMGLARLTGPFPNLTLDQSAGLRVRASESHTVGLFGGLTEAAGLLSRDIVGRSLDGDKPKTKVEVDKAPHASVAAWGRMPYLSGATYSVEAGRQWNPWTTVQSAAASVSSGKVGVQGAYKVERGDSIEFERKRLEATVTYRPSGTLDLWATAGADRGRLGNAELENKSLILGLTMREKVPSGGSTSLSALFGGEDQLILPRQRAVELTAQANAELARLLELKRTAESLAGQPVVAERWEDLQEAWRGLDPALRGRLDDLAGGRLETIIETSPSDVVAITRRLAELSKLVELLGDVEVLDRLVVRALRSAIQKDLEELEVPLFGNKYRLEAPLVLAAAHAYSLGLRPLPGVTQADARGHVDPWLDRTLRELGDCGAATVSDCLLSKLPPAEAERLRRDYGARLDMTVKEAVAWTSDVLRREMNALMLQVIMAADRLNELTVDQGARIGELNARAIMASFARLDERGRRTASLVYRRIAQREEAELQERDRALTERLENYGRQRLAWLHAQPAWPEGVQVAVKPEHWAPLLAAYGDEALFDLILQAKAKGKRVLIELSEDDGLNALWLLPGDPVLVRLPPRPPKSRLVLP